MATQTMTRKLAALRTKQLEAKKAKLKAQLDKTSQDLTEAKQLAKGSRGDRGSKAGTPKNGADPKN